MKSIVPLFVALLFSPLILSGESSQMPPDEISREVPPRVRLIPGSYRLIQAWEAEASANHMTGHAVDDPSSSGGMAWDARRTDPANKHLIYGPYLDTPAGDYVAFYRLRLLDDAEDDITAHLDASIATGAKTLSMQNVWTGDLAQNRYVQIPLMFHSPGGKLECRLFWDGYAGLRLDKITLFALEGASGFRDSQRAPSAAPSGQPRNLPYAAKPHSFRDLFPRPARPARRQIVFDLQKQPYDRRLLLLCLQGLINREQPSLYAISDENDRQWLDWMKQRGWIESEETVADPLSLVPRYREKIKGAVLYDPRLASSKNIAMMVASLNDGVATSARLARDLGLPVLEDLRGRWKTHAEAYRWAFQHLWPELTHSVMACLYPDEASGLRDYLYQQRVFTFWITGPIDGALPGGDPTAETRVMEEILAQAPPNIPVLGFPWAGDDVGIGEGGGVRLFAQYGKFLVGAVGTANLSMQSGFPSPVLHQRRPAAPELQKDKVYLTWLMSDGDNLPVLTRGNFPQLWKNPAHGRVPIAWSLSPSAVQMIPAVAGWYFEHASANDAFVGAVSGVGYTYPDDFAERFDPAMRSRVFGDFLRLTSEALPPSDLRQIWIMGVSQPETIDRYAAEIPSIQGIFPDYGKRLDRYDEAFYPAARGVPVFHAVTNWEESASRSRKIDLLIEQIRAATSTERPAFLHAFIWNWGADLSILPEVMERLGPEYVAVGPDHLAALARQALDQQKVLLRCPPAVVAIEGHPVRFTAFASNATSSTHPFRAEITGGLGNGSVTPVQGELPPFQSRKIAIQGQPAASSLRFTLRGDWGTREKSLNLQTIPNRELNGALPADGSLRFVDRFDAAGLSHRSGIAQPDSTASNGKVWAATTGTTEPGHIVFGPYKPLPAGHYLALFRLKRTGDGGQGDVLARIDVHAAGSKSDAAARSLAVGEAQRDAWRAYPLEFSHSGGAVETRIFWPGKASISAGEILLWELER